MIKYLKAHWRGEFSLARSYWLHGVALTVLLNSGVALLEKSLRDLRLEHILAFIILGGAAAIALAAWQIVGIWRSASHSAEQTGRTLWPNLAKISLLLGCLRSVFDLGATTGDVVRLSSALRDPMLADYTLERRGENNLVFTGAINGTSANAIIYALEDPALTILRVNSPGGLLDPAIQLARYIHRKGVVVLAEGECISACVILLAASPDATIFPDTQVTFHRPEPVVKLATVDLRHHDEQALADINDIYVELGLAQWAIDAAGRQQFWTPNVFQMIRMGLIVYIYDETVKDFVPAYDYCVAHGNDCA